MFSLRSIASQTTFVKYYRRCGKGTNSQNKNMENESTDHNRKTKSQVFRSQLEKILTAKPIKRKPRNLTPPMFIADIDQPNKG